MIAVSWLRHLSRVMFAGLATGQLACSVQYSTVQCNAVQCCTVQ